MIKYTYLVFLPSLVLCSILCSCSKRSSKYIAETLSHRDRIKSEHLESERSPLKTKEQLDLLAYFDIDPNAIAQCSVSINDHQKIIEIPTYSGITKAFYVYGTAHCTMKSEKFTLDLYRSRSQSMMPDALNPLFVPFKDATNGDETYGGGRYLDLPVQKIVDGQLLIDFNRSYNPWCAYGDGFNCPIPPKENHLKFAVLAGEKNYQGDR